MTDPTEQAVGNGTTDNAIHRIAGAPISWGVCEVPGWGYQLGSDRVLAEMREAGLTADVLASVAQPVVALYDEFSPFLATCRWLEQHLPRGTVEIIPAAKHLAMLDNTAGFTDAVKRHLKSLTG